ncbi:hypothetical protein VCHA48O428_410001 [Vibrio chagasii]|nr:hypothetical protein VCHA48O428_410001 [Vibrio chagasii]
MVEDQSIYVQKRESLVVRLSFLISAGVPGVADNGQTFCGTLSTEGGTQSFKHKKAQAVMLGLSISGGVAGVAGDRDSLVEDQNTYPLEMTKA